MQWMADWQLCDQSTGVGRVAFVLYDGGRTCLFSRFLKAPFEFICIYIPHISHIISHGGLQFMTIEWDRTSAACEGASGCRY